MDKESFSVNGRMIGQGHPAFVIAEIGCNFENDFEKAKEMIRAVADAGADAVKFQTFIPREIASKHAKKFWEIEGCAGETQLDEFLQMPRLTLGQYRELQSEAVKHGLIFFSTPSDVKSVDLLEQLNIPLYKISSMDITHLPLLNKVAKIGKPVILSTGASTIGEIEEAVAVILAGGVTDIAILHCTTNYPTRDADVNLRMITHLATVFPGLPVGYSDHTLPDGGEGIMAGAVALGACILEKHFTYDTARSGYDHAISADYECLKRIVVHVRRLESALGYGFKKPLEVEHKARLHARRSIVAAVRIPKGTSITAEMLGLKRPGTGIAPRHFDIVLGRTAKKDIDEDSLIGWDDI